MKIKPPITAWIRAAFVLVVMITIAAAITVPSYVFPRNRLPVAGRSFFWAGINYPWRTYQDFGAGAWGHSGVSNPTTYAEIDTDFANMAARGVRVVKWRIFNDGRYSPKFDEQGYVTGLDEKFFEDIDAALEIADKHDIYLEFTLFSSGFWVTGCTVDGVRIGGRADAITDPAKRRSLVQKAVVPLLQHVGSNPRVIAYEIIAEPEWGVIELNPDEDGRIKVPHSAVRALVRDISQAIHTKTHALATLESNRSRYMREWTGLGLDFYSFSWYDWLEPWDPLDQPVNAHGVDRPIVLGEFPMADSEYYDLGQVMDIAYRRGYAGAFGWSYWGGDSYGQFNKVSETYVNWVSTNWREVNLGQVAHMPDINIPLVPPPYDATVARISSFRDTVSLQVDVQVREEGDYQVKFFLQPIGESTNAREEDQRNVRVDEDGTQRFLISFDGLADQRAYKINMALFDGSWNMRKWFDGLTIVHLKDGTLTEPDIPVRAIEDPCYQQ